MATPHETPPQPETVDWSEFSIEEGGRRLLAPCLTFTLFLEETDCALIQEWYDRALAALGDRLTHYVAEDMTRQAKITPRALGMIPTWLKKPRDRWYTIELLGGALPGIDPASLELSFRFMEPGNEAARKMGRDNWRAFFQHGKNPHLPLTSLRITLPLNHPLAEPGAFVKWVLGFGLVRKAAFVTGECGYSLIVDEGFGSPAVARWVTSLCLRYPGLDWFDHSQGQWFLTWKPEIDDILPLVKRVSWITFVHGKSVEFLGGLPRLREAFADSPEIRIHELEGGIAVQAGDRPQLGERARGELPATYRAVARALRPVRAERHQDEEWIEDWVNAFDREPTP